MGVTASARRPHGPVLGMRLESRERAGQADRLDFPRPLIIFKIMEYEFMLSALRPSGQQENGMRRRVGMHRAPKESCEPPTLPPRTFTKSVKVGQPPARCRYSQSRQDVRGRQGHTTLSVRTRYAIQVETQTFPEWKPAKCHAKPSCLWRGAGHSTARVDICQRCGSHEDRRSSIFCVESQRNQL